VTLDERIAHLASLGWRTFSLEGLLTMLRRCTFLGLLIGLVGACTGSEETRHSACEAPAADCTGESWGTVDPALAARFQAALEAARAEQELPGLVMAIAYRDSRKLWVSADGFSNLATQHRGCRPTSHGLVA
jgi:hypothetical protein